MTIREIKNITMGIGIMCLLPLVTDIGIRLYSDSSRATSGEELHKADITYFYMAATIGIVVLLAGIFMPIKFLSLGFILGGLLCLLMAYLRRWHDSDVTKFVSLLAALILLVLVGFYQNKKSVEL